MSGALIRRLGKIEERRRRPIRERVERILRRNRWQLLPAEVEEIVARHVGTPARIRRLLRAGVPGDQILNQLGDEIMGETAR